MGFGDRAAEVRVRAAFEEMTAPENRLILEPMGDLGERRVLDLGSGLGEAATSFSPRARGSPRPT